MANPKRPPLREKQRQATRKTMDEDVLSKELDERLARLEAGIAEERRQMQELLTQLRTTRIAA